MGTLMANTSPGPASSGTTAVTSLPSACTTSRLPGARPSGTVTSTLLNTTPEMAPPLRAGCGGP